MGSPSQVLAVPPNDINHNRKSLHPLVGEFFFDSLLLSYLLFTVLFLVLKIATKTKAFFLSSFFKI